MVEQSQVAERTGAGDYLGTACVVCHTGEYGLPSLPADTPEDEALRELGSNVERDPGDARWTVFGSVICPDCGDARARWIGEAEVAERREAEAVSYVDGRARFWLEQVEARAAVILTMEQRENAVGALVEALEESWGPLAEVIDAIVMNDESFGTPIWGHPYWTTKLTHSLGTIASFCENLKHPGNEFAVRMPGEIEESQFEPPAGDSTVRAVRHNLVWHAAMAVRWILAIDARFAKEEDAEREAQDVTKALADHVRRWAEMAAGTLVPGDEAETKSILFNGRRSWVVLSISEAPDARPALEAVGIAPATPDEADATLEWLEEEKKLRRVEEAPAEAEQRQQEELKPEPKPQPKPVSKKRKQRKVKKKAKTKAKAKR